MKPEVKLSLVADEVNTEAVELLSGLLERVRGGESVAVAIVEVRRGGVVSTAFANSHSGAYHALNSGAARLASRLSSVPDEA